MKEIKGTYTEESGWVSEDLLLTGSIYLTIDLQKRGYIVISRIEDGEQYKIFVSPFIKKTVLRLYDIADCTIRIETTEEPKTISYANI